MIAFNTAGEPQKRYKQKSVGNTTVNSSVKLRRYSSEKVQSVREIVARFFANVLTDKIRQLVRILQQRTSVLCHARLVVATSL